MALVATNFDEDIILVDLLKQGNNLAFQKIYNCYWDKLFAYTYNRLHVCDTSEEIVQDVFLSLWAKRESIIITSSLSAYLYGATKHRLLNELRSAKVRKAYASDYSAFVKNLTDNSNVEHQDVKDLENSLEVRVAQLPKQCQTVFKLSRHEHVPIPDIAARLKISTKTVENYITQALKYIRTSMGEFLIMVIFVFL
jgi:RNA polymerase sigma-19 factor, ECF subfamily